MGSLLMTLLGRVAAKAADALVAELLRAWGLDAARRKLERHLDAVQCILLDAEAKSRTNPAVRRWMADLKTAAYQADDVLEDFRYEALRLRADDQIHGPSTARKVLSYFTTNSPVLFRLSMSSKIKDALEMIDQLVVEMDRFHFLQHAEAPSFDHPQTHSHVDESEIVGRQDDKELVVKILLDHNNSNNNTHVMVLPIVGMGGIGKTTLAQLVHNDQRVKHHFELVIWICVSDKFVLQEIVRSILQVATMKKSDLTELEALRKELGAVLGKKRYLLVMDDVWNEDRHKWDDMRSLLCSHAVSGSAIIVTSRSDQVSSIMGTLPPHRISALNEDQSWEFFHRNAFGREVEKQEELISMAKSIVHKCKGLPLAIKTMAALLCSKHHNQWFSILDSDVWKDTTTRIVPALQLSYEHLSSEAKICFSFCAIFPMDSPMDKDMLIQLWLANGFIASETRGQEIFDVLVWRCFLQDVKIQNNPICHCQDELTYQSTTCKMHDLMHDLADTVSGNDCCFLQRSTDASSLHHEVQHLSYDQWSFKTIETMEEILVPQPRTVLDLEDWQGYKSCKLPVSIAKSKFMSLRALKTYSIETDMANLKHLCYLDCSDSKCITALPEATSMLYSLQTLKLIGCRQLKKLPEGMRCMRSLRHIILFGCHRLERMPQGIGQLNSLQTLTNCVIDSDASRGIDQLKDLNLGGAVSLTELRKVHSPENAKQGNMSAKHNLKRLSLDWYGPNSTHVGYEVDTNAEGILEALRPHKRLEVLLLFNYTGAKLSPWMHNSTLLEHLTELRLTRCRICKDLPPLWQLHSLQYLYLYSMDSLTSICVGNDDTDKGESCISPPPFFPKLETMIVFDMPKLERWHQEVAGQATIVSFPQLKKLCISHCPMLASMPKMPSLGYLSVDSLGSLTSICIGHDDKDKGESCNSPPAFFPKLETMIVSNMPKLERWHQEVAGQVAVVSFPQLKELEISECPMLASMPKTLPLLEYLHVKEATQIPLYHLMNLSLQSNMACNACIEVGKFGWRTIGDLHFSRLGDSSLRLRLNGLTKNVEHFEEELNKIPCRFVQEVDMETDCDCLFASEPSQIQQSIWNHFRFVGRMRILHINDIVQWPAVEFRNLNHLRSLSLTHCSNLAGSLPSTISDDKNVLPPRLQYLEISMCKNLVEVPRLPASLEGLTITYCRKLVSMPTILGNVKNLREVTVIECDALTTFPDGMCGATALKKLRLESCPRLETLPEGLLQQLVELRIRNCPVLEEAVSQALSSWQY